MLVFLMNSLIKWTILFNGCRNYDIEDNQATLPGKMCGGKRGELMKVFMSAVTAAKTFHSEG